MQTLAQEIGRRIRACRTRQKLTQEALAERAELHHTYIGQVERGEKNLTLASLERIAAALGIALSELFEGIGARLPADDIPSRCDRLIRGKSREEQQHVYRILLEIEQLQAGASR